MRRLTKFLYRKYCEFFDITKQMLTLRVMVVIFLKTRKLRKPILFPSPGMKNLWLLRGPLEKEFISVTESLKKKKWSQISKEWATKEGLNYKEFHKNLGGLVQHVLSLLQMKALKPAHNKNFGPLPNKV